jgi:O-antigen/teichoic acid export membrane protein
MREFASALSVRHTFCFAIAVAIPNRIALSQFSEKQRGYVHARIAPPCGQVGQGISNEAGGRSVDEAKPMNVRSATPVAAPVTTAQCLKGEQREGGSTDSQEASAPPSGQGHRRLAVNAVAGGVANLLKIGVQLVMLPLMAHLLGPLEFGLYALALPTISFFMILADGGLAASLARESRDATLVWSTAFWLLLLVGVTLAAIVIGLGFALAALAKEPRVSSLMALLSISLIMIAASALPSANLTRQGRLVVFAAADLTSTIAGAAFAVALAASGVGAKSLAAQYVTYYTIRAAILNGAAFVRPTLQFQLSALLGHLSTGGALLGIKLADFSGRLVENVVYGRVFGATGLGLYTFANQAPRFICESASGPVWAALYAHALQEDEARIEAAHVNLVRILASLVFPVAALLAATAPEILGALLGPKWDAASTLLRILIPFYALTVVSSQSGAVLLARGQGWLLFWVSIFLTVGRIGAVSVGPLTGEIGVAFGIGVILTLYSVLMFEVPGHTRSAGRFGLARTIAPAMMSSAAAGVVCHGLAHWANGSLIWIAFCWIVGALAHLAILAVLQRKTIRDDFEAIRGLLLRGRGAGLA